MNKLISLEVKRNRLHPYHIAVLIGGFTLLAFHYFMAAIPLIDPTEADIAMFSSYDFLFNLNHLVSMAIFGILGAVMGTRFVIEEYSGAKAVLLFSYPISRKKMMGAKLVYIEVFDRIDKPTMTGKMVYPIVDKFVVQWEEQKKVYPKAVNLGSIF